MRVESRWTPRTATDLAAATGQRERDVPGTLAPLLSAGVVAREGAYYYYYYYYHYYYGSWTEYGSLVDVPVELGA